MFLRALSFRVIELAMRAFSSLSIARVPSIRIDALRQRHGDGRAILLVDVRAERETAVSMIPGAITRQEYERDRGRYAQCLIVPYCTVGYRSAQYTKALNDLGEDAVNFSGSILSWAEAGLPLVTPDGAATTRLHTWSKAIRAPAGYVQVVD